MTVSDTRIAAVLEAWRRLTAPERSAFLVAAWRERWPALPPAPPLVPEQGVATIPEEPA